MAIELNRRKNNNNNNIKEIGWNNSALINSLIKSLSIKLKTSLIGIDLLGALNA